MKFAVLIPFTPDREKLFSKLYIKLSKQINRLNLHREITIIHLLNDGKLNVGHYRNILMHEAVKQEAEYMVFFDSDDSPHNDYIKDIYEAILQEAVCIGFKMSVSLGDKNIPMICSNENFSYIQTDGLFIRPITHTQVVKTEIGARYLFDESLEKGSDKKRNTEMAKELKGQQEFFIDKFLYIYRVNLAKEWNIKNPILGH